MVKNQPQPCHQLCTPTGQRNNVTKVQCLRFWLLLLPPLRRITTNRILISASSSRNLQRRFTRQTELRLLPTAILSQSQPRRRFRSTSTWKEATVASLSSLWLTGTATSSTRPAWVRAAKTASSPSTPMTCTLPWKTWVCGPSGQFRQCLTQLRIWSTVWLTKRKWRRMGRLWRPSPWPGQPNRRKPLATLCRPVHVPRRQLLRT